MAAPPRRRSAGIPPTPPGTPPGSNADVEFPEYCRSEGRNDTRSGLRFPAPAARPWRRSGRRSSAPTVPAWRTPWEVNSCDAAGRGGVMPDDRRFQLAELRGGRSPGGSRPVRFVDYLPRCRESSTTRTHRDPIQLLLTMRLDAYTGAPPPTPIFCRRAQARDHGTDGPVSGSSTTRADHYCADEERRAKRSAERCHPGLPSQSSRLPKRPGSPVRPRGKHDLRGYLRIGPPARVHRQRPAPLPGPHPGPHDLPVQQQRARRAPFGGGPAALGEQSAMGDTDGRDVEHRAELYGETTAAGDGRARSRRGAGRPAASATPAPPPPMGRRRATPAAQAGKPSPAEPNVVARPRQGLRRKMAAPSQIGSLPLPGVFRVTLRGWGGFRGWRLPGRRGGWRASGRAGGRWG